VTTAIWIEPLRDVPPGTPAGEAKDAVLEIQVAVRGTSHSKSCERPPTGSDNSRTGTIRVPVSARFLSGLAGVLRLDRGAAGQELDVGHHLGRVAERPRE